MNRLSRKSISFITLLIAATSAGASDPAATRYAAGNGPVCKVSVSRPAEAARLAAGGARLLADYGSFQLYDANAAALQDLAGQAEDRTEENIIRLHAGAVDTTGVKARAARAPARQVAAFGGRQLHLVQFVGPIKPEWQAALTGTGVRIVDYIPHNAYLVYGDAAALLAVQELSDTLPAVQFQGAYLDTDKIMPAAQRAAPATGSWYQLQLVDDDSANADSLAALASIALEPIRRSNRALGFLNLVIRLPPGVVDAVAILPDLVSIHPYAPPHKFDERQDIIVAGGLTGSLPAGPGYLNWLAARGFTQSQFDASGLVVDVTDSGVDNGTTSPNHFGLFRTGTTAGTSRVMYNRLEGTASSGSTLQGCDGHGNLNAHIIGGYVALTNFPHTDSAGYRFGLGVCPFVKVGSSVIFDPSSYTDPDYENLISKAYQDGARISSDSWGADTAGAYDVDAQAYDALVRDAQPVGATFAVAGNQGMTICFAAGNAGSGARTVGSPGTAKNVITVGAAENVHSHATANGGNDAGGNDGCSTPDSEANSANDMATFSSRGPCADSRVKPEIVAPGTHVTGGVGQNARAMAGNGAALTCFSGEGVCALPGGGSVGSANNFFPLGQQFYSTSSGTSHSTPAVAGGAALTHQWFINQHGVPPSPAMVKALLMNAARYLNGAGANDTLPSNNQGLGMMNLGQLFDGTPRLLRDQVTNELFTATGQTRSYSLQVVSNSKPVRVTLTWTDAPGSTTGNAYKNNLNLTVNAGALLYRGNVFNGALSTNGGSADVRNNTESVFLPPGTTGALVVTVSAGNIVADGVPNFGGALDQDYALVVYNAALASNQPPVLDPIGNRSVGQSNTLTFAVRASDPADGDAITLSASNAPAGALFAFTNGNGTFTWTNALPMGVYTTAFYAVDQDGVDTETIQITVTDGSCMPTNLLAEGFDAATTLPAGWTGGGTANDTGDTHYQSGPNCRALGSGDTAITPVVDYPTQIVFHVDASSGGSGSTATIDYEVGGGGFASLGTFVVSSSGADVIFPLHASPDLSGSAGVRFRFSSTFNTWYLDDVRIDGGCPAAPPPQSPPVLAAIGHRAGVLNGVVQFAVSAAPTDGDPVTLTASNLPPGAVFSATDETGAFLWTNAAPVGVYTSRFFATDNDGSDDETVTLTISESAPIASNVLVLYTFEEAGLAFTRAASQVRLGITAGLFTSGDGTVSSAVGNPAFAAFDAGFTATNGNWFEFTLTLPPGDTVAVSRLSFDDRRSNTGPSSWALRSSADGYATDLAAGGTHTGFATNEVALTLEGVEGSITFRVTGQSGTAGGTWRLDNVAMYGSSAPGSTDGLPGLAITTAPQTVAFAVDSLAVGGTANTNVIGQMDWTNGLTGGAGTLAAGADWLIPALPLAVGANAITVRGTNAGGAAATASVTVTRQAASGGGGGLTNILFQGFEPGDGWPISAGAANASTNNAAADFPPGQRVRSGSSSWQVLNGSATLDLASSSIAGYTGRQVSVHLSCTAGNSGNGSDASDVLRVFTALDGASFAAADLAVAGNSNARWGFWATNILATTAGTLVSNPAPQAGTGSNNFAHLVISLPESATSIALRVTALNNDANERWNVDDVSVRGYGAGVAADADGDGIPDAWEWQFFTNLVDASSTTDTDGDGSLDVAEYLAGTGPMDSNSLLVLRGAAPAAIAGVVVRWQSASNRVYLLSRATNLIEGFSGIASNIPATYPLNIYTDTAPAAPAQAYRIELQRP